jgi:hypothetical protein
LACWSGHGDRLTFRRSRAVTALVASYAFATASYAWSGASGADVTAVAGSAYGFFTNVSLFGGPSSTHGPSPAVTLPAGGSATPVVATAPEGGRGQYGPAIVFGGIWPDEAPTGGPSGPITVRTQGTPGASGSVSSSIDIVLHNPPRPTSPGGIGPGPLIAHEVHSTCTASESGVSGSVRFVNGVVETKYDENTQLPIPSFVRQIPVNPPPNQEYTGTIDHVGDNFRIVLNEQIRNGDGSLTVNAAHMFLLGPIAVGEMIVGQSVCGVTTGPGSTPSPSPGSPSPSSPGPTSPGAASQTPTSSGSSPSSTSPSSAAPSSPDSTDVSAPTSTSLDQAGVPTTAGRRQAGSALAARPSEGGNRRGVILALGIGGVATGGAAAAVWRRRVLAGRELPIDRGGG